MKLLIITDNKDTLGLPPQAYEHWSQITYLPFPKTGHEYTVLADVVIGNFKIYIDDLYPNAAVYGTMLGNRFQTSTLVYWCRGAKPCAWYEADNALRRLLKMSNDTQPLFLITQ